MDIERMNWSEVFSFGNEDIDKDHKKILNIYNELVLLISENGDRNELARILSEMTDYAIEHFKREEQYMKEFAYVKYDEHKQFHEEYIYKVAMFNVDFSSTSKGMNTVLIFLKNWWTHHIQVIDRDYEDYKKKINSDAVYR